MESTFSIVEFPVTLHLKYVVSVFTKHALTWWNNEKLTRGMEVAHAMPWNVLNSVMLAGFCPRNEVKKLVSEFWELKQKGRNNDEYTTLFHELSLLVARMVTPVAVAIGKYLDGLPSRIRDNVVSSKPVSVEEDVRLVASLTDNLVKDSELVRSSDKKCKKVRKEDGKVEKPTKKKNQKTETATVYAVPAPRNPITPLAPQQSQFTMPQAVIPRVKRKPRLKWKHRSSNSTPEPYYLDEMLNGTS